MPNLVIADTSCLILLSKIEELSLLEKLYERVLVTLEVAEEFMQPLPPWIEVVQEVEKQYQSLLELELDRGEASSLALAMQLGNAVLVLDDLKARKVAHKLALPFTGTFGILAKAKLQDLIPSIKPILEKVRNTNFRISEKILQETLREAGEI
jgi:predicted nucleic acid-binding protein